MRVGSLVLHRETCLARANQATNSGADRDRTDDPRLAKPVLSQLSYSPESLEEPYTRRKEWG